MRSTFSFLSLVVLVTLFSGCTDYRRWHKPAQKSPQDTTLTVDGKTSSSGSTKAGASSESSVGKSASELKAKLEKEGMVVSVQTSVIDASYNVLATDGDEKFFLKDNQVVSSIRTPKKDEETLLYWRYRFKGKTVSEKEISDSALEAHQVPLLQVTCDEAKMGVVYDPGLERVTRVFYYEPR